MVNPKIRKKLKRLLPVACWNHELRVVRLFASQCVKFRRGWGGSVTDQDKVLLRLHVKIFNFQGDDLSLRSLDDMKAFQTSWIFVLSIIAWRCQYLWLGQGGQISSARLALRGGGPRSMEAFFLDRLVRSELYDHEVGGRGEALVPEVQRSWQGCNVYGCFFSSSPSQDLYSVKHFFCFKLRKLKKREENFIASSFPDVYYLPCYMIVRLSHYYTLASCPVVITIIDNILLCFTAGNFLRTLLKNLQCNTVDGWEIMGGLVACWPCLNKWVLVGWSAKYPLKNAIHSLVKAKPFISKKENKFLT